MSAYFNRLMHFMPTYLAMLRDFRRQKQFMKSALEKDLEQAIAENDGSLDREDFDKIRHYYGFGVPAIVGEGFCTLRGKKMSARERMASTYQGALTGLYDDFFDKTNLSKDQIREMMYDPSHFKPGSSLEKLFLDFLVKVYENVTDPVELSHAFDEVFKVQVQSQQQKSKGMPAGELLDLSVAKGGYSLLFYRSVYQNPLLEGEKEAVFQVGGLMQLANDLFDIYDDRCQGTRTFFTETEDISLAKLAFQEQLNKTFRAVRQLKYPGKQLRNYLSKLSLGISRCMVCLDQLHALHYNNKGSFDAYAFSREELVCDMEKWKNRFRSLNYFLRTGF